MQQDAVDKLLVVLLEEMVRHELPRILAIKKRLKQGEVLTNAEVDFFVNLLNKISYCHSTYSHDAKCQAIFASISHLLFRVVRLALKNEKRQYSPSIIKIAAGDTQANIHN